MLALPPILLCLILDIARLVVCRRLAPFVQPRAAWLSFVGLGSRWVAMQMRLLVRFYPAAASGACSSCARPSAPASPAS